MVRIEELTSVQGADAIWTTEVDSNHSVLIVGDQQSPLIIEEWDPTIDHATVERIASGLTPFPITAGAPAPVLRAAWQGSVAELRDKQGAAVVTGWLVIDGDDQATLCDELNGDGDACKGPTLMVDWYRGNRPSGMVDKGSAHVSTGAVTLTGSLKEGLLTVGL